MTNQERHSRIGDYHINKIYNSRWSILKTLSDGQWHRNMEIQEKTKLSSRTLAKHLDQMKNLKIIERTIDPEGGYPIPVLYRATPKLLQQIKAGMLRDKGTDVIETTLDETKDPLWGLDAIHTMNQVYFLELLNQIQQNKFITNKQVNFFIECFLWENYKEWIPKLVEASRKVKDNFNITQSLISQAKRQIRVYQAVLKIYEKMEQKNIHDVPSNSDDT